MPTSPTPSTPSPLTDPTAAMLRASLVVAPLLYLAADSTYAARGWSDPTAGVLHVLGAICYGLVPMAVAGRLPARSWLRAGLLLTGVVGLAGNVAYGFDTIHASLGDVPLVDQPGAANLIKPLGLAFPLSLALVAWALARLGHRWQAVLVLVAIVLWPIAHIGDVAALAVPANLLLLLGLGSLVWTGATPETAPVRETATSAASGA